MAEFMVACKHFYDTNGNQNDKGSTVIDVRCCMLNPFDGSHKVVALMANVVKRWSLLRSSYAIDIEHDLQLMLDLYIHNCHLFYD